MSIRTARCLRKFAAACLIAFAATGAPVRAITITFDYTYDTSGFFSGSNASRRDILDQAASAFSSRFNDSLSAITPSGGNSWSATFSNPSSPSSTVSLSNLSVAANTIVVYVGAADLGTNVLGQGGPGGYSSNGNSTWLNNVAARGQTGALGSNPTDFGPWGGAISFSTTASWYFDSNPTTVESFPGQNDFYSVALHEIGHVLGIGTADSWFTYVAGGTFTGPNATAANGGSVALSSGNSHWLNGTLSTVIGTTTSQEAAMDPTLTTGTRKFLTTLDVAGLHDVGWTVVPEASTVAWSAGLGAIALLHWRRRRQC